MTYRFSSHTLHAERRLLLRGDHPVILTPKVFQTLLVLVENHDRVMSKDELCQLIWPNQFVEEANLTQNISVLRRALDAAAADRTHIVTFHGHGYRFIEPVTIDSPLPPVQASAPQVAAGVWPIPPLPIPVSPGRERLWRPVAITAIGVILVFIVALSAAFLARHHSVRPPQAAIPAPSAVEPMTRLQGEQFEPAWSPDGHAFAFINRLGQSLQSVVYIQRTGEMQPQRVASDNGVYNSPAWSPDGRYLALTHTTAEGQELVLLDLQNGKQRHLTKLFPHRYGLDYRHLDWSPDGTMLAVDDKETESDPLSLYLVHLADGSKSRLTYSTMDIIGDVAPRFSPDGSTVAFIRIKYQGQNAVFLVSVTGSEAAAVVDPATLISDIDWESNNSLLFAGRLDDKFRFWRTSTSHITAKPSLASQIEAATPLQFALRRGTGEVAFSAYSANLDIWGTEIRKFKQWRPVIMSPGQDVNPAYSPDGARIAFRSDFGGRERLWVSDVHSSNAHAVDTGSILPAVHAWDADNKTLLFKGRYTTGLLSVPAEGGGPVTRVSALGLSHPARSVDGKTIFARTGHFVYQVHKDDGHVDRLTAHGGAPIAQSTDGRYIYFAQGRMQTSIARLDLKTGQQQTILSSLIPGYSESWALTEDGIYYLSEKSGKAVIAFHSFAERRERVVTDFPGDLPPVGDTGFAASPDGNTLLIVRAEAVASNVQRTFIHPAQ